MFGLYEDLEDHLAPPATMSETASYYHGVLGTDCPWDCGSCPSNIAVAEMEAAEADEWWVKEPDPIYHVQTPYGTEIHLTFTEAKMAAVAVAAVLGKAVKVVKI